MEPFSIVGLFGLIFSAISAFADGKGLFRRWREKRRAKKAARLAASFASRHLPRETPQYLDENGHDDLDTNLTVSPRRVHTEYNRLSNVAGPLFNKGDDISFQQIRSGLQRFQQQLLQKIRTAITVVNTNAFTLGGLMSETDMLRSSNISSMGSLFQRVSVARPVARGLTTSTVDSTIPSVSSSGPACWCQGVGGNFSCSFCGRTSSSSTS